MMRKFNDNRNFYFVYGNHGDSVLLLEDYYLQFKDMFEYCIEKPLLVSKDPVPGHWNIFLEHFDAKYVDVLRNIKVLDASTQFICVVTEFRTENTFNSFSDTSISAFRMFSILDNLLRHIGIIEVLRKLPVCLDLKRYYKKWIIGSVGSSHYTHNIFYWKKRYESFLSVLPYIDQLWLVSPSQEQGYSSIIESEKLWKIPIIPFTDQAPKSSNIVKQHDIDFLFTGTLTKHRMQILNALQRAEFSVVSGFFPYFLKNAYLERTKSCLHIKPHLNWPFSSNMRLHTLLMAGKYVFSEICDENEKDLLQQNFVEKVPSKQFVETVGNKISNPSLVNLGLEARNEYIRSTESLRLQVRSEFRQQIYE